ncbi:MAG: hypothetical protein NW217_05480 [Hyphomicrobiaceae bacterium]|nr:hypothetical protein [Hyphomicrobiaceae bacterium]
MTASLNSTLAATPISPLYQSVGIASVSGGEETNPLLMSKVSSNDFKEALKGSLLQNQFHAVGTQKYQVSAEIQEVQQPLVGLDMSVTSKVRYKVVRTSDKAVVYDNVVTATHTATVGDSLVGSERLRLANEGAIKKNIASFIAEVGKARA